MEKFRQLSLIAILSLSLPGAARAAIDKDAWNDETTYSTISTERQKAETPTVISPGDSVKREVIKARQVDTFQIHMEAGTSVRIAITERNTPLDLTLISGGAPTDNAAQQVVLGRTLISRAGVVEPTVLAADKIGDYTIRISAFSTGNYTIAVGMAHTTGEQDRKYAEANRLMQAIRLVYEAGRSLSEVSFETEKRVEIYRDLKCREGLALSLVDAGMMNGYDIERNLPLLQEAQQIFRSLNSTPDVQGLLAAKRSLLQSRGYYQEAIATQLELVELFKAAGAVPEEASEYISLGVIYHRLADEPKAREFYNKGYQLASTIDPPTARSLNIQSLYFTNLANLARGMNGGEIPIEFFPARTEVDFKEALSYEQRSIEIQKKVEKQFPGSANWLRFNILQMANTFRELGSYEEALKQLDLHRSMIDVTDASGNVRNLMVRGSVYSKMRDLPKTEETYDKAISLLRAGANPGNYAGYLLIVGSDYFELGDMGRAGAAYREALGAARALAQADSISGALLGMARVERELGNFNNAKVAIEEAINFNEALRARITNDELRTTYFSSMKRLYDFYVDLLMQARKSQPDKAYDAKALEISERSRSRSLLDLLSISRVDLTRDVSPELLRTETVAKAALIAKANEQSRVLLGKHTEADVARLRTQINELTDRYAEVQAEIRTASPRYAALTQPKALDAQHIQQMLDSGTVLLEYALGDKKSYLWVVATGSITSYDLPPRAEIEAKARKIYETITTRNAPAAGATLAQLKQKAAASDVEYAAASLELSQMLLGPAGDLLKDKRLVVVPDGALNYISFAALPLPRVTNAGDVSRNVQEPGTFPLVGSEHEIVTLPSASTLARLREETQSRKPADMSVAIFADPIFGSQDSRIAAVAEKSASTDLKVAEAIAMRDFERATQDLGLTGKESAGLPRLPFSRREADSIFRASPRGASLEKVDLSASKDEVFKSGLDRFRIIHFATHGLLDSQHPELSGVVLSLVDKDGKNIDGFLRLQDIYNLKLNADLVVLSACNTALGKEVRGEGLIGLTRGFMYAGAPRVVASLWKVDDAATAELMSIFYRKMLQDQLRPAAALRAAQMELSKQPRWRSPYYWAPFVLQGEWK